AIADPTNEIFFSAASLWGLAIKVSKGKLTLPAHFFQTLPELGFSLLPISGEHAWEVREIPMLHSDPFDRMLIAQARTEGLTMVTVDSAFDAYEVSILSDSDSSR